jgi:hypothetical protein
MRSPTIKKKLPFQLSKNVVLVFTVLYCMFNNLFFDEQCIFVGNPENDVPRSSCPVLPSWPSPIGSPVSGNLS